jgi:transcription antitermination factor NusG
MKPFSGLTADAFATYAPEKWSSNVHNLARMRVKDAVVGLCERVQAALAAELADLERAASDEMPNLANQKKVDAQWVFWFRDAAARSALGTFLEHIKLDQSALLNIAPQDKHAALAVVLRQSQLWVGLYLGAGATVDRRNIVAKLQKGWERERLLDVLKTLPAGGQVGVIGKLQDVTEATLTQLEDQAAALDQSDEPWQLGYALEPATATAAGEGLVSQVADRVRALVPVYRFLAWTRDNDQIEAQKQLQEEKKEKRRQAAHFNTGDKVRIMTGLFAGKTGVVMETDTKAQVKVRVGKMSVVVAGAELTPAA